MTTPPNSYPTTNKALLNYKLAGGKLPRVDRLTASGRDSALSQGGNASAHSAVPVSRDLSGLDRVASAMLLSPDLNILAKEPAEAPIPAFRTAASICPGDGSDLLSAESAHLIGYRFRPLDVLERATAMATIQRRGSTIDRRTARSQSRMRSPAPSQPARSE
jgi:hypothetical protein